MTLTIEYTDDGVVEWQTRPDGSVDRRMDTDYTPTIYATAETTAALDELAESLTLRRDVDRTAREQWRPAFRRDPEPVLRIDVASIERVRPLAGWIRREKRPGTYRLFNVDFSREFRYCLETGCDPAPARALRTLSLTDPTPGSPEPPVQTLEIDGERLSGSTERVIEQLKQRLAAVDPDVLVCSTAALVPALFETATQTDMALELGRAPGYEKLAGESTYESYGQVGHSPARYNVPGRVLIDCSNTFFYSETNLQGCLDLVARSGKPLQELSWASIGNVLTAIQIREATERGVLIPWNSWRHEFPKTMAQLHEADRGGFTFAPDVGVHEAVHELDFSSLYPNIICTRNVSPETIRCECHDRGDVPGLGYSICDEPGYLPDVLQPIIDDRDQIKAAIEDADDPQRGAELQGKSAALKWILVSCFGYQGFSNAKFGRIECHEAINAYAREILLDAKECLEEAGWRVLHGIVDSLWVTAREGVEQESLEAVANEVTEETEIRLEYEAAYEWIAFVRLQDSESGALTKYFGKRRDGGYKYRGIECRQRSTPAFVSNCQRALIERFDETRDPQAVCATLARWLDKLGQGTVDPDRLVIKTRASKRLPEYSQSNRTTAALTRQDDAGIDHHAGQDVRYLVADDEKQGRERVALPSENLDEYDVSYYSEQLLSAAASVLSPVGWRHDDIQQELSDGIDLSITSFA